MSESIVITIDGPSASGKTSVSRDLANGQGWTWVSTGAFYRGLAFVAASENMDMSDQQALADLAVSDVWSVEMGEQQTSVLYRGADVTSELGKERVGMLASQISQYPKVREALLAAQRGCARPGEVLVAEGRDCGSVVFPQAVLKVYLTANLDDRAKRRSLEEGADIEAQKNLQKQRDLTDASRQAAPMQVPEGGCVVDSSSMGLSEVVKKVEEMALSELKKRQLI